MPVAMLARIYNAISPSIANYDHGADYYGSPVHKAFGIETAMEPPTHWPFVQQDFIKAIKDEKSDEKRRPINRDYFIKEVERRLRLLPRKSDYEVRERDLPVAFFYEFITMLQGGKNIKGEKVTNLMDKFEKIITSYKECFRYEGRLSSSSLANKMFFEPYAYVLSCLIFRKGVSLEALLSSFENLWSQFDTQIRETGPELRSYKCYIKEAYDYYIDASKRKFKFSEKNQFKTEDRISRSLCLYGPAFLMRSVSVSFYAHDKGGSEKLTFGNLKRGGMEILIDRDGFQLSTKKFDSHDNMYPVIACAYCMAAEWFLFNAQEDDSMPASPEQIKKLFSEQVDFDQELWIRNPNLWSAIQENIEEARNQERKSSHRFMASTDRELLDFSTTTKSLQSREELDAYVITKPTALLVEEYRSLHVLVPKDSKILEGIIHLRFHFIDKDGRELPFTRIGIYDQDNDQGHLCDAYYFLPDPEAQLPEQYPSCRIIARAYPEDETIANVVVRVD